MPLPFDNPDAADSADMTDSSPATAIVAGPAPAPGYTGGDFDNPDNPDSPDMTDGPALPPASVTGCRVSVPVPVSYVPDPLTAALTLTQNGITFGPYPAAVTQAAGGFVLSATFTAAVSPGEASVQPGDLLPDGFVPNGPPQTGPLELPFAAGLDISIVSAQGPYTDISSRSSVLAESASSFIYAAVSAAHDDGSPMDTTQVEPAFLFGDLATGTWQAASWQTDEASNEYAAVFVAADDLPSSAGSWSSDLWYMTWLRLTSGQTVKIVRLGRLLVTSS